MRRVDVVGLDTIVLTRARKLLKAPLARVATVVGRVQNHLAGAPDALVGVVDGPPGAEASEQALDDGNQHTC